MINVRTIKQAIWKMQYGKSIDIRIKYAFRYAQSSNYWKIVARHIDQTVKG